MPLAIMCDYSGPGNQYGKEMFLLFMVDNPHTSWIVLGRPPETVWSHPKFISDAKLEECVMKFHSYNEAQSFKASIGPEPSISNIRTVDWSYVMGKASKQN